MCSVRRSRSAKLGQTGPVRHALVTTDTVVAAGSERTRVDSIAFTLLLAVVALSPIARGWVLWSAPGGDEVNQWVLMTPLDWPLALLVVLQIATLVEERSVGGSTPRARLPIHICLAVITLAWLAVAAMVNPSWRALDLAFRLAGIWAIVRTVRRATSDQRTAFLGALVMLGVVQAIIGIAQSRTGEALGLGIFEFEGPLYEFGGVAAGRGSFTHPYHLTALLVVCVAAGGLLTTRLRGRSRLMVLASLPVMGTAVVLTSSRSGYLAIGAVVLLWSARRKTVVLAAAVVAGLLVGASLGIDGVAAKAEATTDSERIDSGRRQRIEEAVDLADQHPLFGVGPGRYVIELRDEIDGKLLPAHNLVAQQTAESGYIGGALVLATLGAFGIWLLRRAAMTMAIGVSLVPFHLLDTYPHTFPLGFVISGFWLASVVVSSDSERTSTEVAYR